MDSDEDGPPKYDPEWVERTVLEDIVGMHPTHLTLDEWLVRTANDPGDGSEAATITDAIGYLRRTCLVRQRTDGVVEPTQAALRAVALLAGVA